MKRRTVSLDDVLRIYHEATPERRRTALCAFSDALRDEPETRETKPWALLTRKQVAAHFARSERWVDMMVCAGHLPRLRSPGACRGSRFRLTDVRALEERMLVDVGGNT